MQTNACSTDLERASEALQTFIFSDEGKALGVLCDDLRMKDPGGLFAGDTQRLRRFLVDMSSDVRRCFHMTPWSYSGSMLRFRVVFRAGRRFRGTVARGVTSMSIWVDLAKDGRIREMVVRYRPETIISTLSKGIADRLFRILMYRAGFLRQVSSRILP